MPKSSFIHLLLSFHFLSYGGEERGDTHSPLSSHPVIILSPLTISSLWLLDLFTVAMSPFHIALYRFRLQMKKTKSAWCKVCATGLVFGFQLNKTHGCHLWVQLIRVLNSNTVFPCMPHPAQDTVKRLHSSTLVGQRDLQFVPHSPIHTLLVVDWTNPATVVKSNWVNLLKNFT